MSSPQLPPAIRPRTTWPIAELPRLAVTEDVAGLLGTLEPARLAVLVGAGVSVARLAGDLAPFLLAILLCRIAGLEEESMRLLVESSQLVGRSRDLGTFDRERFRIQSELAAFASGHLPDSSVAKGLEEMREVIADEPLMLAWALTTAGRSHLGVGNLARLDGEQLVRTVQQELLRNDWLI